MSVSTRLHECEREWQQRMRNEPTHTRAPRELSLFCHWFYSLDLRLICALGVCDREELTTF
jgi:hypothetical protein